MKFMRQFIIFFLFSFLEAGAEFWFSSLNTVFTVMFLITHSNSSLGLLGPPRHYKGIWGVEMLKVPCWRYLPNGVGGERLVI